MSARARAAVAAPAVTAATGKVKIEVEVDAGERESWINDFALNVDVFGRGYCGYWAFGVAVTDIAASSATRVRAAWLLFEQADSDSDSGANPHEGDIAAAHRAYKAGKPLPKGWHILDRAAAERAYGYLVARAGALNTGDSSDYDVAIQMALLGEVRYG